MIKPELKSEFKELAKPMVEFLQKNFHPHARVIIDCVSAEIVEGICGEPFEIND